MTGYIILGLYVHTINFIKTFIEYPYAPFDPFHIVLVLPLAGTIIWYIVFYKRIIRLQNLELFHWRVDVQKVARIIRKFADQIAKSNRLPDDVNEEILLNEEIKQVNGARN